MKWNLKGGVIIIGSLLWQDYLNEEDDKVRLNWRTLHLEYERRILVKLPIRYGRLSTKLGNVVTTMVFSNKMKNKKGLGYVIPFKKMINNQDDLLFETYALFITPLINLTTK